MVNVDLEELRQLIAHREGPCVSLLMPAHHTSPEQNQIQFASQLHEAATALGRYGLPTAEVRSFLEQAALLSKDDRFWREATDGLAVYSAAAFFRAYWVPLKFEPTVHVGRQFYIVPLVPLLQSNGRFFVLALSQHAAQLYQGNRHSIQERELPVAPESRPDARARNKTTRKLAEYPAPSQGRGQSAAAVLHWPAQPAQSPPVDVAHFLRDVDRRVCRTLRGERAPLVLASVGYMASIYRSLNGYPNLIADKIPGHPDLWSPDELRQLAWQLVEPHFRQTQREAILEFHNAVGDGRASRDLQEVVLAAEQGRIGKLLIARHAPGRRQIDWELNAVEVLSVAEDPDSDELLNYAAVQTLIHDGDVYAIEPTSVPELDSPVAAVFRDARSSTQKGS